MSMRFREVEALLKEAESRENLAVALKGGNAAKEFRQEREALEKAAGGKKKLDEAAKILAEAKKYFAERVAKSEKVGQILEKAAEEKIQMRINQINGLEKEADNREEDTIRQRQVLSEREQHIGEARRSLDSRKEDADQHEKQLDRREHMVRDRENQCGVREAEIKRFDDWRSAAPA